MRNFHIALPCLEPAAGAQLLGPVPAATDQQPSPDPVMPAAQPAACQQHISHQQPCKSVLFLEHCCCKSIAISLPQELLAHLQGHMLCLTYHGKYTVC